MRFLLAIFIAIPLILGAPALVDAAGKNKNKAKNKNRKQNSQQKQARPKSKNGPNGPNLDVENEEMPTSDGPEISIFELQNMPMTELSEMAAQLGDEESDKMADSEGSGGTVLGQKSELVEAIDLSAFDVPSSPACSTCPSLSSGRP